MTVRTFSTKRLPRVFRVRMDSFCHHLTQRAQALLVGSTPFTFKNIHVQARGLVNSLRILLVKVAASAG